MTLTVLGVDPSLAATGLCRITIDNTTPLGDTLSDADHAALCKVQTVTVHSAGTTKDLPPVRRRRVQAIRRQVLKAGTDADLVLIETPFYNRQSQQAAIIDRSWLWGTLLDGFDAMGIPVAHVAVAKVKGFATGKGAGAGTDKTGVAAGMVKLWGEHVDPKGDNEYDALVLASIGAVKLARHRLPIRVLERHLELVAGINWDELDEAQR